MTNWKCPSCEGEFPSLSEADGVKVCPWCSRELRHEWPIVEEGHWRLVPPSDDDEDGQGFIERMFK